MPYNPEIIPGEECEFCSFRSFVIHFTFSPWQMTVCFPSSGPPAVGKGPQGSQVMRETSGCLALKAKYAKGRNRNALRRHTEHMGIEVGLQQPKRENWCLHTAVLFTHAAEATERHPRLFPQVKELHFTPVWRHLFIADPISPDTGLCMHVRDALFNSAAKPKQESSTHLLIGYQTFPLNNYVLF